MEDIKLAFSNKKWIHDSEMNLTGKKLLIALAVFISLQVVIGFIIGLINVRFPINLNPLVLNIAMNLLMILIIPLVYKRRAFVADFFKSGSFSSDNIQSGIFYGLVCILANIIVGALLFFIYSRLGVEPTEQQAVQMISELGGSDMILIFIGIVLAAPIAEEFFFRGVIQRTFAINISMRNAIIVNSLIFALIHQDWFYFPQIFILSVILSISYNRTGNIITPVIAHILSNSLFMITLIL